MANGFANALGVWQRFYMLSGASAATLIGLLFVVVTLGVGGSVDRAREAMTVFLTPVVVHFGLVLTVAAFCLAPIPTGRMLGELLLLPALGGMASTIDTGLGLLRA